VCTTLETIITHMDTNYISLKSRRKSTTHKTKKLTQKWNFSWSSYWHATRIKRASQEFHNKCTFLVTFQQTNISQHYPALDTSVHFKASQQKISQLRSVLNQHKRGRRTCPICKTNLIDAVWLQLTARQWTLFLILCKVH